MFFVCFLCMCVLSSLHLNQPDCTSRPTHYYRSFSLSGRGNSRAVFCLFLVYFVYVPRTAINWAQCCVVRLGTASDCCGFAVQYSYFAVGCLFPWLHLRPILILCLHECAVSLLCLGCIPGPHLYCGPNICWTVFILFCLIHLVSDFHFTY